MAITSTTVRDWIRAYAAEIAEHRVELVKLDTAIGDGDHGTNMDRGMRQAVEKLEGSDDEDIGALLKAVGMTLVSKVGGAAGPLYGTLFLQMGTAAAGQDELDLAGWTEALDAGVKGVQARGKAELGDKTMIDALNPAVEALRAAADEGADLGRRAASLRRRGGGGHAGDNTTGGAQGPGELPGPAQRGASGSGRHVVAAAAGSCSDDVWKRRLSRRRYRLAPAGSGNSTERRRSS